MDFTFLEFYIKKKYNQKVEEYFQIGRVIKNIEKRDSLHLL
jgi:hypothetical protein